MPEVGVERIKSDGHDVVFGRYCLADLAEHLSTPPYSGVKLFILVDENTHQSCLSSLIGKVPQLAQSEVLEIPAGEDSKSIDVCKQLWSVLGELGADRQAVLINLGGGVVSDLGGFVAGAFKRGIRFINIPTSLLAQVDASVGGKVGVNLNGLKNEVGLFNNPEAVYVDPQFLDTLPRNELLSGFAEMVKHALIFDAEYWKQILEVSFYDMASLDKPIHRSIQIKSEITNSDPFESGRRKVLNFGHTIGHALESHSFESDSKNLLHGEAIAAGMVCEAFISYKKELLYEDELDEIVSFIFSHYPKVNIPEISSHRIIQLMLHDKKNREGRILMSLLNHIGDSLIDQEVHADLISDALNYYRRWVG
jgi:3-dehydroquinate synthase